MVRGATSTAKKTRKKAPARPTSAVTARSKAPARAKAKPPRVSTHPVKPRTPTSLRLIERLRVICLALPDATEQIAWGEPTWRIGGRLFAQLDDHHHGSEHVSVWLPAPAGAQAALIEAEPARFFRPAYVGHRGWIGVVLDTDPDWGMVASLVEQAYDQVRKPTRAR